MKDMGLKRGLIGIALLVVGLYAIVGDVLVFLVKPRFILKEVLQPVDFGFSVDSGIYMVSPLILISVIAANLIVVGSVLLIAKWVSTSASTPGN